MGPTIYLLSLLIFTWLAYKALERWKDFQMFKNLGIPGPRPSLLFGNLIQLRKSGRSPLKVFDEWEERYGEAYGYYAGTRPTLVIRDLDTIREVLVKSGDHFNNRMTPVVKAKPLMDTLVGLRDRRWKELRSILAPTFSASKMRQMSEIMHSSISTTEEILSDKGGMEVDVLELFQGLSCEVICECALAMRVDCQRNQGDRFLTAVREFLRHAMNPLILFAVCFPWFARATQLIIDKFAISALMTNIVCQNVENVIRVRRAAQGANSILLNQTDHKIVDVLQTLLDAAESSHVGRITDDEIVANSWIFLLGGFETTSSALTFTSYLLALNPEVQQTLFEELQAAFSEEENVTYDLVQELTFLDQVVCESLRLYPPVVTFVVRETNKSTRVGPFTLPKGVCIQVPVWQIHHDPKLWPNPLEFRPSRFKSSLRRKQHSMAWIPFGAGPRNCVGKRFGLLEIKLALARIVRSFRIVPSPRTETELRLNVPTVTIVPDKKIYLRFLKR